MKRDETTDPMGGASDPRTNRPRTNREPAELARKRSLRAAPHMIPLARHVDRIRAERGADRVPDFDPTEAGVRARILLLLEAPGPKATQERGGSGFISPDNNDATAENMWYLLRQAGVDRQVEVVTWNVVPWYVGDDSKIRGVTTSDLAAAGPYLEELVTLLPNVGVVLLLGTKAQRGWKGLALGVPSIVAPHPSPVNLRTRPHLRQGILEALSAGRRQVGLA